MERKIQYLSEFMERKNSIFIENMIT